MRRVFDALGGTAETLAIVSAVLIADALGREAGERFEYLAWAVLIAIFGSVLAALWVARSIVDAGIRRGRVRKIALLGHAGFAVAPAIICLGAGHPEIVPSVLGGLWLAALVVGGLRLGYEYLFTSPNNQ